MGGRKGSSSIEVSRGRLQGDPLTTPASFQMASSAAAVQKAPSSAKMDSGATEGEEGSGSCARTPCRLVHKRMRSWTRRQCCSRRTVHVCRCWRPRGSDPTHSGRQRTWCTGCQFAADGESVAAKRNALSQELRRSRAPKDKTSSPGDAPPDLSSIPPVPDNHQATEEWMTAFFFGQKKIENVAHKMHRHQ